MWRRTALVCTNTNHTLIYIKKPISRLSVLHNHHGVLKKFQSDDDDDDAGDHKNPILIMLTPTQAGITEKSIYTLPRWKVKIIIVAISPVSYK